MRVNPLLGNNNSTDQCFLVFIFQGRGKKGAGVPAGMVVLSEKTLFLGQKVTVFKLMVNNMCGVFWLCCM